MIRLKHTKKKSNVMKNCVTCICNSGSFLIPSFVYVETSETLQAKYLPLVYRTAHYFMKKVSGFSCTTAKIRTFTRFNKVSFRKFLGSYTLK